MTNEEFERSMQFILQQQAQFWASMQSLEEIVRQHTAQIGELARRDAEFTSRFDQLTGGFGRLSGSLDQLTELMLRLGRIVEEQGRAADERMTRTDERLNVLIATVDRFISRHGGDQ